eukprot:5813813-Prymnesium_polylepis.1
MPCVDDLNIINRNTLAWATPIAARGLRRALTPDDLPPCPRWFNSKNIEERTSTAWAEELARAKISNGEPPPSVLGGVCRPLAGRLILEGVLLELLSGLIAGFGRPFILQHALRSLDPEQGYTIETSLGLAVGLGVAAWVENWARYHGAFLTVDVGGIRIMSGLIQLITTKTVRIRV